MNHSPRTIHLKDVRLKSRGHLPFFFGAVMTVAVRIWGVSSHRSIGSSPVLTLGAFAFLAVVAFSSYASLSACRTRGIAYVLKWAAVVWPASFALSLAIHRGEVSSARVLARAFLSLDSWPESRSLAGLDIGRSVAVVVMTTLVFSVLSKAKYRIALCLGVLTAALLNYFAIDDSTHLASNTPRSVSLLLIAACVGGILHVAESRLPDSQSFPGNESPHESAPSNILLRGFFVLSALGVLSFGSSIFDLLARQHVERVAVDSATGSITRFDGPLLPILLWTVLSSSFLGILVFLPVKLFLDRPSRTNSCRQSVRPPSVSSVIDRSDLLPAASLWVTALAFWIRLGTLLTVAPTRTDGGDPLFYHVTANLLARGRGFPEPLNFVAFQRWIPSALHGPAYPIVLSAGSRLGGSTYFDHKFISILIGTSVVGLVMYLANRLVPGPQRVTTVLLTGLFAASYPNLWLVDSVLFPEGLMAALTLVALLFSYSWWRTRSLTTAGLLGAAVAACALTRGEGLLLGVLLILPLILSARELTIRRRLLHLFVAAMACLSILAPWTIRNSRSFDTPVPLSTNGNELFVYANCPGTYGGKFLGFWLFQCQQDVRSRTGEPPGDEAQKALFWRRTGLDYAREHVGELPRVVAARIGRQWDFFRPWQNTEFAPIEGRNKTAARVGLLMYFSMILPALFGLRQLRRSKVRLLPLAAVFASVTLTAAYAYGTTRFRVPFEPILCLLAAIGVAGPLSAVINRWRSDDRNIRLNVCPHNSTGPTFVQGGGVSLVTAFRPKALGSWLSWTVVGVAIAATLPALYHATGSSMEEGFMLVFPELVNKGFVPNKDFLHLYGPGSLDALAGWFRLFGTSLEAERTWGLVQHLLFVSGLMVLTRPWGRVVSCLVGLCSLLFVFTPIGLQALAWSGALGLGVWAVVVSLRARVLDSSRTWLLAGLIAGMALTFRPDLALALALALGFSLWSRHRRSIMKFVAGLLIGLIPLWFHVVRAGPKSSFEGMFVDPVFRLRGGRALPRPPSLDHLDGALQVISEKFAPWWGLPHLSAPKQLFIWFFLLPVVSVSVLVIARLMARHRTERGVLTAGALFGLGLLPQAIQRTDSAHFLWVSAVSWPLMIVAIIELFRRFAPRTHPRAQVVFASGALALTLVVLVPYYTVRTYGDLLVRSITNNIDVREVRRGDRHFYLGDERPWRATLEMVDDLDERIRPGDRLFVGPVDLRQTAYSDAFIYHLFPEATPATYFIEMDPGLANRGNRLAQDVASADWLVLTRFWSGWIEPNASVTFGSDAPNQVVENSFCLQSSYQNDLVRLYHRCPIGDGVGPYEGPYKPQFDYAVEVRVPVPPRPDGTCTPTCMGRPSATGVEIGIDTSVVS